MIEYLPFLVAVAGAVASWYTYRWGRDDGRAEGYEDGRAEGRMEGAGFVSPSFLSGGPRERHSDPSPALSGGPREPA